MCIGDDGALTWEFFGDLGEAGTGHILDEVTGREGKVWLAR